MSCVATVQYGNNGVELRVRMRGADGDLLDISGSAEASGGERWILIQTPGGENIRKSAPFTTSGTDGSMTCILSSSDIDELGMYKIQAYIKTSTSRYTSEVGYFEVVPNIDTLF